MKRVQLCSCGSGRTQQHCCGNSRNTRDYSRLMVMSGLCVLLVGGVLVLAIPTAVQHASTNGGAASTSLAAGGPRFAADGSVIPAPGGSARPSAIRNPEPWQYDPATNQHWSEEHWHWHDGPPPPVDQRTPSSIINQPTSTITTDSGDGTTPITTDITQSNPAPRFAADGSVIPTEGGSNRPSKIKNPNDGQYDPESDQTWSSTCWHWHEGKQVVPPLVVPPAGDQPPAKP